MRTSWQVGDHMQGRWEIFKILQGGPGVVYIVYDHAFREPFAAKTFRDEVLAYSPSIAERFTHEALAWIGLDVHPNVTQARMLEVIEGKPFLFLEYVSGGDLAAWIGTPKLTEDLPQVLRFGIHFCDGMIYAATKGIRVHRDIKPRNCLITHDGVLKVTDFGLAKLLEEENLADIGDLAANFRDFTLTATAVGTCTHMAPEQFKSAGDVDSRADIYSFGVMLHQMVCGELPFIAETWQGLEQAHKTQAPPYLSSTNPQVADLIHTCLAKDPAQRFSDFGELRDLLRGIYQSIVGSPPPKPPAGAALTAVQWNNKGSSLDNLGRHAEAIACYDVAIQLDSQLASAQFNKGVALFATHNVSEALACYEQALKINPDAEQTWSNKGVVLKTLGKTNEALGCYDRALQINPRYANAWLNKGVLLRTLGKAREALACYDRALKLNPQDASAWTNKGNVLFAANRAEEAVACYDRALRLNSALDLTWLNKGIALNALKRCDEALSCFDNAIETNPRLQQAWYLRGITLVTAFEGYREALPYLQEAERLGVKEATEALAFCQKALANSGARVSR